MPSHFHKVDETGGGLSERERNQTDHISGRPIGPVQLSRYPDQTSGIYQGLVSDVGSDHQQQEIPVGTITRACVPGSSNFDCINASVFYRGSETELPSTGQDDSGGHTGVEVVDAGNAESQWVPLLRNPPNLAIESDASPLGWGAALKDQELKTGGQWSTSKQEMHINCLELLAACVPPDTSASTLFQLEAGSINGSNRHLHSGLESVSRYANPPWCLLLPTLAKIQQEKAKVVLVAPLWKTQPWYPLLLQLLIRILLLIPIQQDVVISPTQEEFIMPAGVLQLVVWPLSGIRRAFRGSFMIIGILLER